ncbi:MAG: elongation factor Ts [Chloroflexota bacterium]|nr:elongation factor Ts [Chloroflexota bacterium]
MAEIGAAQVKQLREMTGAGMMDCKRALTEAEGDVEKAKDWLRQKGMARAQDKAGRTAGDGIVEAYLHAPGGAAPKQGALLELNCESDFVARTDDFKALARELALQVVGAKPRWVRREEVPADIVERETAIYRAQVADKPANIVERIVDGKLEAFYSEVCLVDQVWVKDEKRKKKVGELVTEATARLGEKVSVARFARFEVGEVAEGGQGGGDAGGNGAVAPSET